VAEIDPFIRSKLDASTNHCQELTTNVITMPIPQHLTQDNKNITNTFGDLDKFKDIGIIKRNNNTNDISRFFNTDNQLNSVNQNKRKTSTTEQNINVTYSPKLIREIKLEDKNLTNQNIPQINIDQQQNYQKPKETMNSLTQNYQ
jgi:hypothetical protein